MALKIRFARCGRKKRPSYWLVVAEATAPRDGRFVERVGTYNPLLPKENVSRVTLKDERITYWLSVGAQPTERVALLLSEASLIEKPKTPARPKKSAPKKKAQERASEKEAAAKAEKEAKAAEKKEKAAVVEASKDEGKKASKETDKKAAMEKKAEG
jgi:small subunit ribosomal protein S16